MDTFQCIFIYFKKNSGGRKFGFLIEVARPLLLGREAVNSKKSVSNDNVDWFERMEEFFVSV